MAARSAGNCLVQSLGQHPGEEPMQRNCNAKMAARSAGKFLVKARGRAPLGGTNATKLKRDSGKVLVQSLGAAPLGGTNATKLQRLNGGAQRRKIFWWIPVGGRPWEEPMQRN